MRFFSRRIARWLAPGIVLTLIGTLLTSPVANAASGGSLGEPPDDRPSRAAQAKIDRMLKNAQWRTSSTSMDVRDGKVVAAGPVRPPSDPGPWGGLCYFMRPAQAITRYVWCHTGYYEVARFSSGGKTGTVRVKATTVAFGRNDGERNLKIFLKVHGVEFDGTFTPYDEFEIWAECVANIDPECRGRDDDKITYRKTLGEWDTNPGGWLGLYMGSDESSAQGHHDVSTHTWRIAARARDASGDWTGIDNGPQSGIRCDSSPEFTTSYAKACVFADFDPRFTMSVDDPDITEVAQHVDCAQDEWLRGCEGDPGPATYPRIPGGEKKDIFPGTWLRNGPSSQGLTRIKNDRWSRKNRKIKGYACESTRRYKKTGLPSAERPSNNPGTQCDEFPFASTWEGAANTENVHSDGWNYQFSVRAVDKDQNRIAGDKLKEYYKRDRILPKMPRTDSDYTDEFWVNIADDDEGPGPDPNIPPDDHWLEVDAGPDASGDEGSDVELRGSVESSTGSASASWSYTRGSDVDNGATCEFGDKSGPRTSFRCTDDGTYTVTLTGDDGVSRESDSATVKLRNVAPKLKQGSPEPWQVYRVEDKVAVKATFTDPGTNDTHTCAYTWDDGTTSEKKAEKHACDKPHVFDEAGMFTVTTKVTDDDGGSDSARVMVIVYDPRAGLLTATGKAGDLKFIAAGKYLTADSTRPLGALAFTARKGGERFKLTSLKPEWLVITDEGRAAMKGTGRLNGEKGYGYVAYAKAGGFRAVVWPLSDGTYPDGSTWYDNAGGESYDLDRFDHPEVTTGAVVIDSGWIPGIPRPVSGILADLT